MTPILHQLKTSFSKPWQYSQIECLVSVTIYEAEKSFSELRRIKSTFVNYDHHVRGTRVWCNYPFTVEPKPPKTSVYLSLTRLNFHKIHSPKMLLKYIHNFQGQSSIPPPHPTRGLAHSAVADSPPKIHNVPFQEWCSLYIAVNMVKPLRETVSTCFSYSKCTGTKDA